MSYLPDILFGLLGFLVAFASIPLLLKAQALVGLTRDQDLHHSSREPISRLGGMALAGAFVVTELVIAVVFPERREVVPGRSTVVISSLAMFALGWADDLKPLGARKKLLGQVLIAGTVFYAGIGIQHFKIPFTEQVIDLGGWGVVVTTLWLVGMTNLVNLIDGIDGLAGGICLMLMILLVYVGHASGSFELLTSGMVGALLAFLYFNFPPARIFMGDGGAYFLGFQIGIFSLVNSQKGTIVAALAAPLFVLALPILDTSIAILRRGLRGLPVFRPDRRHLHHQLLASGLSQRRVVLVFYSMTLVFLAMGFAAFWSRGNLVPVLLGVAALFLVMCAGRYRFSRQWLAVGRTLGGSRAIRQEVQYALCLARWLCYEGDRCSSLQELWSYLLFAARRLGFVSVRLTLADGERVWQQPGVTEPLRVARFDLPGGSCGTLELKAALCQDPRAGALGQCALLNQRKAVSCPCVADSRVFDIVTEVLAESWSKAAGRWRESGKPALEAAAPAKAEAAADPEQGHGAVSGSGLGWPGTR
jgi:UDP-GlcNAc:undecaprenyl-phosphate/decaprenyl-phosphate GlcNAc-1-phosphate transferase